MLDSAFVLHEKRYVSNDNIVSVDSIHYEMPRGHAGTKAIIRRNVLDNTLSFLNQDRLIKLCPVDLINNARDKRAGNGADLEEPPKKHTRSSAAIAFNKDIGPIVDADGGYPKGENNG